MPEFPSFESRTATIEGVNLHYLSGGAGQPVVLVHGLGSSAAVEFYYNLEALAAHHQVIALDLPGFGQSDKPPLEYSIDLFTRVLSGFVASLRLQGAALVGVSMGGRIALGLALESPAMVGRLVLVDALGIGQPRAVLAYRLLLTRGLGELTLSGTARALRGMNPKTIRRVWSWYLRRPGSAESILSDERISNHSRLLSTPAYRSAYLSALRSIAGSNNRLRDGIVVEDRLSELAMPTLLVWGRHDHLFPAMQAEAAGRRIKGARIEIFEASGHTPQMEEPDRFNALLLDFLRA